MLLLHRATNLICNSQARSIRLLTRNASRLVFDDYGEPSEVLKHEHFDTPIRPTKSDHVLVRMLMSPINPADINIIQGSYPVRPEVLPACGGGEGVGVVEDIGPEVESTDLSVGDWVIPCGNMSGCWSTHMQDKPTEFIKIRNDIPVEAAACIRINPSTAYRMLKDFVDLKPGDVIIQNGANSACGQCVIQIAKELGLISVNIVRDRDNIAQLKDHLTSLGANHVLTLAELRKSPLIRRSQIPAPRLALNCVGGDHSNEIARVLSPGGVHVTYGGMSREPVQATATALIFKDVSFRGFWLSRWIPKFERSPQRIEMYDFLMQMMFNDKLKASSPPQLVKLQDYVEAMDKTLKGFKQGKFMFDMREEK